MKLYIKQKLFSIGDKYNIYNERQEPIFKVWSEIFAFGAKVHLLDQLDKELFYIEQKLFKFLPEYHIYNGNSLCAVIKKELTFLSPKLSIKGTYGDFSVEGNLLGMDFNIKDRENVIGSIHKVWLSLGDCYEMSISEESDIAFFTALVVAVDHCLHNENNN